MSALLPGLIPPGEFGNVQVELDLSPDWVVLGYAMILAIAATVVFTIAPAVRTWRLDLLPFLKAGEQGVVRGRSAVSGGLVVLQLAFSVLLLTTAALAYRSLSLMDQVDLGFNRSNLLLVTIDSGGSAKSVNARIELLDRMLERLRAVPGVESASYASYAPSGSWPRASARASELQQPVRIERNYVGPDFLQTLGVGTRAGGELRQDDTAEAVINQHLADALWPGETAVGRTFLEGSPERPVTVVGVASNAYFSGSRRMLRPHFVLLAAARDQSPSTFSTFHVRYAGGLDTIVPAIGRALRDVDATVPLAHVRTMDAQLEDITWMTRTLTMLLTLFAAGSLLIATLGQYAAMSFVMRQRVRDFGIRIAIGASPRQILSAAVGDGLKLTALGLLIGLALGAAIGRSARSLLYGVTLTDVPTYAGVLAVLGVASLFACYLPAYRASRISPVQALRHE
jgi:predicted permease